VESQNTKKLVPIKKYVPVEKLLDQALAGTSGVNSEAGERKIPTYVNENFRNSESDNSDTKDSDK
jgi:hypothetical protein